MDFFGRIAEEVQKSTGIETYARVVERVVSGIMASDNFWDIVDSADAPIPAISEIVRILERERLVEIENREKIRLTQKGLKIAKDAGLVPFSRKVCDKCRGRGVSIDDWKDVYDRFVEIVKDRPKAIQKYDQGYVTPETTIARVAFADSRYDVRNKEIIVIGDDDLVSIALGLTGLPKRIVLVEIDERIVDFVRDVSKSEGFEVESIAFDIRKPVPDEFVGKFDTFFTDPPETIPAIRAFITRGITLLKGPGSAGYFGYTLRDSSLSRWRLLQELLVSKGVVITDLIRDFNEYENWDYQRNTKAQRVAPVDVLPSSIWYRSALYRIEVLPGVKQENELVVEDRELYLDEEGSTT